MKVVRVRQTATEHNALYPTGHQVVNRHPADTLPAEAWELALQTADFLNSVAAGDPPWWHDFVVEDDPSIADYRNGKPVYWKG